MVEEGWLDELEWDCVVGDLFAQEVDAIAVPTEVGLWLNHRLGMRLLERCGRESLDPVLASARGGLPGGCLGLGEAVSITVAGLPHARRVVLVGWWAADNQFNASLIYGVTAAAIREANARGCRSLALPMFGARGGVYDLPRARAFVRVLRELHRVKGSTDFPLKKLLFCSMTADRVAAAEVVLSRELYTST